MYHLWKWLHTEINTLPVRATRGNSLIESLLCVLYWKLKGEVFSLEYKRALWVSWKYHEIVNLITKTYRKLNSDGVHRLLWCIMNVQFIMNVQYACYPMCAGKRTGGKKKSALGSRLHYKHAMEMITFAIYRTHTARGQLVCVDIANLSIDAWVLIRAQAKGISFMVRSHKSWVAKTEWCPVLADIVTMSKCAYRVSIVA